MAKGTAIFISVFVLAAIALSVIWAVPYIYTLIGFATWSFIGHIITADDDIAGGWSNPDGIYPFPWNQLLLKGFILATLCVVAFLFPGVRSLGGAS